MEVVFFMDDSLCNNGFSPENDLDEVMIMDTDGVWKSIRDGQRLSPEKVEQGIEAIKESLKTMQ